MAHAHPSLKKLLSHKKWPHTDHDEAYEKRLKDLQLMMVRIQQGVWHRKDRLVIMFEGFDAAGKGGAIKKLTQDLDPRGYQVHPIGPPLSTEQGKHWLYRFWKALPPPGKIAIFDRSWYGRVLVERVEKLTPKDRLKQAYSEINEFERALVDDGVTVIKIFMAITKDEQLERFEKRLKDPYKQWKVSLDDIKARRKWDDYVEATEDIFKKTDTPACPWTLIAGNSKSYARTQVLEIVTRECKFWEKWMEDDTTLNERKKFKAAIEKELKR